jgi:hypothetical protein
VLGEIHRARPDQLLCFVEICLNILKSRIPLRKRHLARLRLHADRIRRLSRSRSPKSARRILNQQGRGLPVLASVIASVLIPLIGEAIANKISPKK